ncbi:thioredoxin family protein [Marinomonas dokdonensis]|uniref:thioredoxin family protein n=1 Tax=Marinomonas dokdonensis TaxID=328224 RepID=UPI0040558096
MLASSKGYNPQYSEQAPSLADIEQSQGYLLLEFGAPWCGHCQGVEPLLRSALHSFNELTHVKVFDGKGKRLGRAFKVTLWPTLILLKDGRELARLVRPTELSQIQSWLAAK